MEAATSEIIRAKRLELGLSQKELAKRAGVGLNTIYNVECNKVVPNFSTYQKICDALGIRVSSIFQ
jgi:DNA-binding XRE family transcriptional regulator